jgi:L-ascorbate metabolism protein UlaG (beta-lactamase superfamily)
MTQRNPYYDGPPSDHFDGLRFFNPGQGTTDRSFRELLRWQMAGQRARWPKQVPVTPCVPPARSETLRVTMVGHATVLIQLAGLNIVTDPVWSKRVSPVRWAGPSRVTQPGVAFDDLPPIDLVLLSHNHYDHLDLATLKALVARDHPRILTPLGNDVVVRNHAAGARIEAGDWGTRFELPGGEVTIVRANHWSSRTGRDRRMALWGGFMLRLAGKLVYFAGDTGEGDIFGAMRDEFGSPDVALLPIGAYAPRWFMAGQHCDPAGAVRIFQTLGASQAIAIHWGCWQLTDEPRDEPPRLLAGALAQAGIAAERFAVLEAGEWREMP